MPSLASRQYDHLRSRMSSVLLLAILILAMPGVSWSQQRKTARSTAASSQDDVAAPQDSSPKGQTPPRKSTASTPPDSSFLQRLFTAIVDGLTTKDTASQQRGGKTQQPQMPKVIGMDTMSALKRLGLTARTHAPFLSYVIVLPPPTLIPVDRIADQLPGVGAPVSRGMTVRLTLDGVPRPPTLVTVPDMMGRLYARAADTLRALGFVEEKSERRAGTPDSVGRVIGQNPSAGTQRVVGGPVAITIGLASPVIMPKVTGLTLAAARQRLSIAGIDVGQVSRRSAQSTQPVGSVVRQLPESGSVVLPATRIVLTQAVPAPAQQPPAQQPPALPPPPQPARMVVMPLLVGKDSVAATRVLRDSGLLDFQILPSLNASAADTVRAQSPASGRRILSTSPVVLRLGPPPIEPGTSNWLRLLAAAYALAIAGASALTARRIWPPPQIVPHIQLQPMFSDIIGAKGSLVDVSVSLRSHVEHERSELDLTGSPLE